MNNSVIDKCDRVAIGLVIALMVMQLSLTKIFARILPIFNYSYNTPLLCVVFVLMILATYLLVFIPRLKEAGDGLSASIVLRKYIKEYGVLIVILGILMISIVSTDIITIMGNQLRITNILTHNLDYFYAFLALPLTVLFVEEKWKWNDFADVMLGLTTASAALRIFVSLYYSVTGIEITIISKESAGLYWFRNNRLRVTAPCFICLFFAVALYMIIYSHSMWKRVLYITECAVVLSYSYFIWQARAGLVTILAGSAMILLFGIMSKRQLIIRWSVVVAAGIAFIAMGGLTKLLKAFSMAEDAEYVMENRGHYYAYSLFFGMLKDKPMGSGLSETLAVWFPNGRAIWMCDAGIMYSLVPMGIFIAIFYVVIFSRGIWIYVKNCKKSTMAVLALALTSIVFVGELSMDCFFTPLAFEMPVYLAILEYVAHKVPDK